MIAGTARFLESSDKMVVSFWSARDRMIDSAANMASSVVSYVNNMVSGIQQAITGKLAAIWEGAKAKIESVRQKFADMYDAVVGNSYVPDMVDGIAQSMMQLGRVLVDPAVTATDKVAAVFQNLQGVLGDIFGRKAGGIIGIIGQFATALAPLIFGKGAPGAIWETGATGGAIGMASGGSGVFGGRSGVDRNLLSLNGSPIARVSRGEHFAVSPANDRAPRNVTIQQTFQFEGVAVTKTEFMQGLMMTKSATIGAIRDMDRRR
jgi:hypothetical protein